MKFIVKISTFKVVCDESLCWFSSNNLFEYLRIRTVIDWCNSMIRFNWIGTDDEFYQEKKDIQNWESNEVSYQRCWTKRKMQIYVILKPHQQCSASFVCKPTIYLSGSHHVFENFHSNSRSHHQARNKFGWYHQLLTIDPYDFSHIALLIPLPLLLIGINFFNYTWNWKCFIFYLWYLEWNNFIIFFVVIKVAKKLNKIVRIVCRQRLDGLCLSQKHFVFIKMPFSHLIIA